MNATAVKKAAVKKVAAKKVVAKKPAVKRAPAAKPAKAPAPAPVKAPVKAPVPAPVKVQAQAPKVEKIKIKLVRDSFTMPADDWALIAQLKERAVAFKRPAKKSELLRAGLQALAALPDAKLKAALDSLLPLKPGRPKGEKGSDKADKK
ncbi:hypothetical protein [Aquabacterium sp. NJ1]|uniref:hypothetical protein n=1 Tax=Aquabacterium sp. NJ1 TaxID=1538295 RepID=UPI00068927F2|nr:hypothetical protein [Aquabacterium sp. NJ1]